MFSKDEFIGSAEAMVGSILRSPGSSLTTNVMLSDKACGQITLKFDPVTESNFDVVMTIGARTLPPTKSKLILEIYRKSNDGSTWLKVNEFDPIPYDANPVYPQYKISGQELCNSNKNLEL
jgi:hypothetical protein